MSDMRMVAMTAEQFAEVERCVVDLMRANRNERASTLMTLSLAYKFAPTPEPALPDNVVQLDGYSKRVPGCAS